ncbi:exo-1,4-beta-glucosidase [Alteromonadaceae bacterium Bs31]|nr:exo-1,4-beta-glucosidase [Alteromonadaceae bacterium Bs31]
MLRPFLTACLLTLAAGCSDKTVDPDQQNTSALNEQSDWPTLALPIAQTAEMENRIKEHLANMSLEQKVGQMMQPSINGITPEQLKKYYIGSVLNGGGMYPGGKRQASAEDWQALADAYWLASMDMPEGLPAIPIIWGTDAVHGHNNVVGATLFPHNSALGAANEPELVRKIGQATAKEVAATGIDWNFSPTAAVAKNLRWGRSYESFGEQPELVAKMTAAMVLGLQGDAKSSDFLGQNRVIATVKHFIGDGGTHNGDDQGKTLISEQELIEQHAAGYFAGLSEGAQTVMASYSSWQGLSMHAQRYLLTDVLKERMGFDGFVVSDWNAIGHIDGCTRDSCATAINAGVDMLMVPDAPDWQNTISNTIAQVKSGEIPMSRIDDAVSRILRVKLRSGTLFVKPSLRSNDNNKKYLSTAEHRQLAREAVRRSLVLLKNNASILPLPNKANILVTGNAADSPAMQSGGWTISWQGNDTHAEDFPLATSIYKGIENAVHNAGGMVSLSSNGEYQQKPDVAIVVFGEEPYAEMRGDLQNLKTLEYAREYPQALSLLKKFKSEGIPTVSVFVSGRPRLTNKELNQSDAFVMAWLPGSEGAGIADLLFASESSKSPFDFHGRLPFSWPSQTCPQQNGQHAKPLFPFGFGLTYSHPTETPLFDENYAARINGCNLPDQLAEVATHQYKGSDISLHLELKSLEKFPVKDAVEWHGISASVERNELGEIKNMNLHWQDAPRNNAVIQNGKTQSLLENLAKNHALQFDLNIAQAATEKVWIRMECGHLCADQLEITEQLKVLPLNSWHKVYVPLSCVAQHRTDLAKINSLLRVDSSGNFNITLKELAIAPAPADAINLCDN